MNLFDDMPDVPKCPHCGHDGDGLQWSFPDTGFINHRPTLAQCACLACGAHGPAKATYADAIAAFMAGETVLEDDAIQTTGKQQR